MTVVTDQNGRESGGRGRMGQECFTNGGCIYTVPSEPLKLIKTLDKASCQLDI